MSSVQCDRGTPFPFDSQDSAQGAGLLGRAPQIYWKKVYGMLKRLTSIDGYMDFIAEIGADPDFHDPLRNEEQMQCNLLDALNKPAHQVWGVFEGETIIGLFVFLILEEEAYMEMLVGLSRTLRAYEEMLSFLKGKYQGYQADFVYHAKNHLLHRLLQGEKVKFDTEQQKMVLKREVPYQSSHRIELYRPKYRKQYCAIHLEEGYWTADKVIDAPDRFRIILAIEKNEVVGYIDVTYKYEENEPFDVFVKEEYRKRGYGKAMLAKAIALNGPKAMMLLVNVDNAAAIALYESLGFVKTIGENSITAHVCL